jgi:AcrR family transcriptional regulator
MDESPVDRLDPAADASTPDQILAATRDVLARSGTNKLSVSEVALNAGVSRPTLYRWFASKQDLLEAFLAYEGRLFEEETGRATKDLVGAARLDAAMRCVVEFQKTYSAGRLVQIEPQVAIAQSIQALPQLTQRLHRLLPGRDGAMKAAVAVRIATSHYLLRTDDSDQLLTQLRYAVGLIRDVEDQAIGDFIVHFASGQSEAFDASHRWCTIDGGALKITASDGRIHVYSPSQWSSVDVEPLLPDDAHAVP